MEYKSKGEIAVNDLSCNQSNHVFNVRICLNKSSFGFWTLTFHPRTDFILFESLCWNVFYFSVIIISRLKLLPEHHSPSKENGRQKFSRNKQAGGGAYIPATLRIVGPSIYAKIVLERIPKTICEFENKEEMPVEML